MNRLAVVVLVAACGGQPSSSATADAPRGADASTTLDASSDSASDASTDAAPIQPNCSNGECTCSDGYRPCTGGCCVANLETVTLDGVAARDVRMEYALDGTAYILVSHPAVLATSTPYRLELYARAPGAPIASTGWTADGPGDRQFDLAVRSDGTVMIAYAPGGQEQTDVDLVTWNNGVAQSPVKIGTGFAYDTGVSATLDGDQTLWVTWSSSRSGGMSAYSIDTTGTQRTWGFASSGTIEETDAQYNAALHSVFSFYGDRYTGMFASGVDRVAGTGTLGATCPADSAAFDDGGHLWSAYNSYPSTHTFLCRDGDSVQQPSVLDTPRIAVDAEQIAYTAAYDANAYTATWYASPDNHGWTHGTLATHYGVPTGWNSPGSARAALARDTHGKMSIVVVPEDATMGAMVLATFQ